MKANSEKTKQSKKATRRVLAGVLCGASVLSLVLSLVMPPISQAIANDAQTDSTEKTVMGGGSSSESTDVDNTNNGDTEKLNSDDVENGVGDAQPEEQPKDESQAEDNEAEEYVNFCITSASCTSIEAWEKCGKFDEWMFIDLVDNDFCKRITLSGYKILKLNKWILDQEFGKITPKSEWKQQFWVGVSKIMHNQNFAKFSYKKSVSPLRVYYTNRNIIYVNKKLKKYGSVGYENYNCKGYIGFVISFMIPSILRAGKKIDVLKATVKGVKDGMAATPSEWSVKGKNMVE